MFRIGDYEAKGWQHPDPNTRRESVRFGWMLDFYERNLAQSQSQARAPDDRARWAYSAERLRATLQMNPDSGNEQFKWSYAQACRLVHWRLRDTSGIRRSGGAAVSPDGANFVYEVSYENLGDSPVKVDLIAQSMATNGGGAYDVWTTLLNDARWHVLTIQPGRRSTISGTLQRYVSSGWNPTFVSMPDPGSLYSWYESLE
jgi:hypothetical protein